MSEVTTQQTSDWQPTACNLCYANCGILVKTGGPDGRSIIKVKGDRDHPASRGYICNKAAQINFYQSAKDRIAQPQRRRADGGYDTISWDVAIQEIAQKMAAIKETHGGDKIFRYGGGGQGNHLGGSYFSSVSKALGMRFQSNALAQEKTGYAWMMGRMFGTNVHGEMEHTQCLFIVGKNPWQSNSIQRARVLLKEVSQDPERTLIVVDPRRTESAELADIHLAVKPGRDAWALSAMIAHVIQQSLIPTNWLNDNVIGLDRVLEKFSAIDVEGYATFAGLNPADVRAAAEAIAKAKTSAYYEDLGVQMAPHSTLLSYLNLLMMTITGHFGRPDTLAPLKSLIGQFFALHDVAEADDAGYEPQGRLSPVVGARIVGGLVPCNVIPEEILTEHPNRYRALWVESGNPCHSLADSHRWREAMRKLDLSVVIDVSMTETARQADYVLPASSQYEKWESTFFNFEYPENHHHLRAPVCPPMPGTLSEPEIHARMIEALQPFELAEIEPLKAIAKEGLETFSPAMFEAITKHPHWGPYLPYVLYRTLGPALPEGAEAAAAYWLLAQRFATEHAEAVVRAGFSGQGLELGNALFEGILQGRSGVVFSKSDIANSFAELGFADNKIRLAVGEMLDEVASLASLEDLVPKDPDFPLLLAAGERRAYTANTIVRDPGWVKKPSAAALAVNPHDAAQCGVGDGEQVRLVTQAGAANVLITVDDRMMRGTLSLPNGLGLLYPDGEGKEAMLGVAPNELTTTGLRDKFLGTPLHKHVPARIEPIAAA
ncbi:MAG: molybdopterin oxidoreductase family protein [OM182 bacterium]|nr:MAG: molybdopterin oxidoreductase family protein [OM182 bacterium]